MIEEALAKLTAAIEANTVAVLGLEHHGVVTDEALPLPPVDDLPPAPPADDLPSPPVDYIPTVDDVNAELIKQSDRVGPQKIMEVLMEVGGAVNIAQIDAAKYPEILQKVKAL